MILCSMDGCGNPKLARGMCRKHYERWRVHGDANIAKFIPARAGEPAKFIASVPDDGTGCVRWPYATNGVGYAQINTAGRKKALVSRIMCERRWGPPPSSRHVAAHSCGNGHLGCIAPWHLSWKTQKENIADMAAHGTRLRGSKSPWAKLTEEQVAKIRCLNGQMSQKKIGAIFGISQTMVSRIIRGEAWAA